MGLPRDGCPETIQPCRANMLGLTIDVQSSVLQKIKLKKKVPDGEEKERRNSMLVSKSKTTSTLGKFIDTSQKAK